MVRLAYRNDSSRSKKEAQWATRKKRVRKSSWKNQNDHQNNWFESMAFKSLFVTFLLV